MHECFFKSTNNDYLFARTLDFSFELEPEFVFFPRHYPLSLGIDNITNSDHYAFMGLAKNIGSYQIADGINEHGLASAAFYFEGYASYADETIDGTIGIAAEQLVQLVLAQCKSIRDIKALFKNYTILSTKLDLSPGYIFGENSSQFQRMNIACSKEVLVSSLNRLKKAINNLV